LVLVHRPATIERPLFGAFAVAAACLMITLAVRGSEPVDSGWSVAAPSTVLGGDHPADAQIRIAINHVLEQSQLPPLQAPAQKRPLTEEAAIDEETYATSADGWRPAHIPTDLPAVAPKDDASAAPDIAPQFRSLRSSLSQAETPAQTAITAAPAPAAQSSSRVAEQQTRPANSSVRAAIIGDNVELDAPAAESQQPAAGTGGATRNENADADSPLAAEPAPEPLPPLSKQMQNLRTKVRRVLKSYYNRPLNSRDNDPWEMMHGMLAYGVHSQVRQGGPQGKLITSVGWLCYNRPCKGMTLLYVTPEGELRGKQGVGLQGHMGQFLAMLAQCQVSPDYPIRVRDREFTIRDLIEAEKKTCYPKTELTFKLIALMHYLESDATWVNDQGASWDIPRLIREELAQPIRGAACGGTHRLAGLSLAARTRVRRGEPLDGEYLRAAKFVEKYHNYAFQMQNRDGSLSTEWFRGRGEEQDIDRRVKTTGHILEWLIYSLNDKEVRSTRTFRAVNYLASLLANNYRNEWEVGPMCHANHALRLYDERVFQPYDGQEDIVKKPMRRQTAKRPSSTSRTTKK
jgi:hypothetical protein